MANETRLIDSVCNLIESGNMLRKEIIGLLRELPQRSRVEWNSRCPLISAVTIGYKSLVNELIDELDFDINSTTQEWNYGNWCSLGAAIHSGNFYLARILLTNKGLDVSTIKNKILRDAIYFSSIQSVKFLIEEVGADVNATIIDESLTKQCLPIHLSISRDVIK
jgi:hypothetical protein